MISGGEAAEGLGKGTGIGIHQLVKIGRSSENDFHRHRKRAVRLIRTGKKGKE